MIIDEAHRLKNPTSRLFEHLCAVPYQHCLLLTGTPLQNKTEVTQRTANSWSTLDIYTPSLPSIHAHSFLLSFYVSLSFPLPLSPLPPHSLPHSFVSPIHTNHRNSGLCSISQTRLDSPIKPSSSINSETSKTPLRSPDCTLCWSRTYSEGAVRSFCWSDMISYDMISYRRALCMEHDVSCDFSLQAAHWHMSVCC